MTTEKALREALKFYAACVGVEGEEAFLDDRGEKARAALSLPETQGEPVAWVADAPDPAPESVDEPAAEASEQIIGSDGKAFPQTFDAQAWAKAFNETLTVLGYPQHDEGWLIGWFANAIMRGFDEAHWRAAPPSQPAQGEPVAWVECDGELVWQNKAAAIGRNLYTRPSVPAGMKLVPVEPTPEMIDAYLANNPKFHSARQDWAAMLAAAPAAPTNGDGAFEWANRQLPHGVARQDVCTWVQDSDGAWNTSCGVAWEFNDEGRPTEHGAHFCHHCGGVLLADAYDTDSTVALQAEPTNGEGA